jgi:hypothetical protein
MPSPTKLLRLIALLAACLVAAGIVNAQELTMRCDPDAPGALSRLSRAQKKAFMKSQDTFIAGHYAAAFSQLRELLSQVQPDNPAHLVMTERTAEAALFSGDRADVITLLKPIEDHDAGDCPARTLLARAYAENGQTAERDAEINALAALHNQAPKSPAGKLDVFLLEQHGLEDGGRVEIWYALRPYGPFNTHLAAMFYSPSGDTVLKIELSSYDGDQAEFKKTHPDLAAKGDRQYSLDAFEPDPTSPNGQRNALIRFFEGKPSYDTVREIILAAAKSVGKSGDKPVTLKSP